MGKRLLAIAVVCSVLLFVAPVFASEKASKETDIDRIQKATEVFKEINAVPEKSIPSDLLEKANCVVIIPGMLKAGFIFGGRYGRGIATCRETSGKWSPPSMMMIAGGSWGAQIGGESTDLVLLVMNEHAKHLLFEPKFTVGAGASVAAGPVGREAAAETNATMRAEFLTYSRSRGVFAGITLQGAELRPDTDGNQALYGQAVSTRRILQGHVATPAAAQPLLADLATYARRAPEARR